MKNRSKYLFKNTAVFAIGNIGTKLIAFFLVPLYTNVLSTDDFGTADLIYTIGTILVPLLTLNVSEAIMRFALDKNANRKRIMNIGITLLVMATVIGLLIVPIAKTISEMTDYVWYIYLYTITLAYSQTLLYYLRGKEELMKYSIGNIIHSLAIAVLNLVFLLIFKMGLKGYFTAYIAANAITAVYAFCVGNVKEVLCDFKWDNRLCKNMLKYSVVLIPNSFMWWVMNSSDRVMLTSMMGSSANGIFAISYKIPTLLITLTSIFNQAWCYSAIREDDSEDKNKYYNEVFGKLAAFVLLTAAAMILIMKPFMSVYVSDDYYIAWRYTPYLIFGFVFLTMGTFLSSTYTVNKDSKGFLYSGVCGAVLNIILNWILIKKIGISGAAVATMAGYIAVFAYRVKDIKKYVKIKYLRKEIILSLIIIAVMGATMFADGIVGQLLLAAEFALLLFVQRKTIKAFWTVLFNTLKHIKK